MAMKSAKPATCRKETLRKLNPNASLLRIQCMTPNYYLLRPSKSTLQVRFTSLRANLASGPGIYWPFSYFLNSNSLWKSAFVWFPAKKRGMHDNAAMNTQLQDATLIDLLDRIAQQDHAALKALYELCASKLYGLALRVVTDRDWAEDVLQESFLSIWRSAGDYRASLSPPMAWLGLIVRSRALDMLRRRAADRSHLTQDLDDTLADTLASDAETPLDTAQASEQAWALHQCLVQLEKRQREVVSLAYVRDMSHSELAAQLQLPLGTVKTWIRRGLDQLRTCMSRFA